MAIFRATDIVEMAMELEKSGEIFYSAVAKKAASPEVRALFDELAEQEKYHYAVFSKMSGTVWDQPELMRRVSAAVRVGGRRWNIRLDNGIDVRLPEENPALAWARLAEYERIHKVLAKDIGVLDLRLPDRLIVQKAGHREAGTET